MSVSAIPAQGSKFYISSTAGGAKTISGIILDKITKVTATAHGMANGDVVTFAAIVGTTQLNGLTAAICNVSVNTFYVQIDSTLFTPYTSGGTATPLTWTLINQVKAFKTGDATASKIDVTDLNSTAKEFVVGLIDNGSVTCDLFYLKTDPGQAALLAAFNAGTVKSYKLTDPVGSNYTFTAGITKFGVIPDAAVDGVLTGAVDFQISGPVVLS